MESEFERALQHRDAWASRLAEAVEVCRSMSATSANRLDAYHLVNIHLVGLCIQNGPESLPVAKWAKVLKTHMHRSKPLPVDSRSPEIEHLLRLRDELGPDPSRHARSNKTTAYLRQQMFLLDQR